MEKRKNNDSTARINNWDYIGDFIPFDIPPKYSSYVAIAILAALDSVLEEYIQVLREHLK